MKRILLNNTLTCDKHLLDRFIRYCRGSNLPNADFYECFGDFCLEGMSQTRAKSMVMSFAKALRNAGTPIIFEIATADGAPIYITKLTYDIGGSTTMKRVTNSSSLRNVPIGEESEDDYSKWKPEEKRLVAKASNSTHPSAYMDGAIDALELVGFQFSTEFESSYNATVEHNRFNGRRYRD